MVKNGFFVTRHPKEILSKNKNSFEIILYEKCNIFQLILMSSNFEHNMNPTNVLFFI